MSRGAFLMVIGLLVGFIISQNYNNEKAMDRYENLFSEVIKSKNDSKTDTTIVEIESIKDSIKELSVALKTTPRDTNIIKKSYVRNVYIVGGEKQDESVDNIDLKKELLTKSD